MDTVSRRQPNVSPSRIEALRERLATCAEQKIKLLLDGYDDVAAEVFREAPIPGAQFQGQDLTGLDFTGAELLGANFKDALITGARFDTAHVTQGQLREARDWKEHVRQWTLSQRPLSEARQPGDIFSIAPFAPELVLLPDELAIQTERPIGVIHDEWCALQDGRLAMATMPVTVSQFGFHRAALRGQVWSDIGALTPAEMSVRDVRDYLAWIRRRSAADFRIPSHGLLAFLARKGRHDGDSFAAVTTDSKRGLTGPERVNPSAHPGTGRCNKFGLHDVFGNTREFVDTSDQYDRSEDEHEARLASIGGCFRESREQALDLQKHRSLNVTAREHGLRLILFLPSREVSG